MRKVEITKMSSRGQIVIPKKLRKDLVEGTPFIVLRDGTKIILKKMPVEEVLKEFDKLLEENKKIVKKTGLRPSDVPKIIQKIRERRLKR